MSAGMKFYLQVVNGGLFGGGELYEWDCPDAQVWLPEGAWLNLPSGDQTDEDNDGFAAYVKRTYFDVAGAYVGVEIQAHRVDPPKGFALNGNETAWLTARDGDLHAGLASRDGADSRQSNQGSQACPQRSQGRRPSSIAAGGRFAASLRGKAMAYQEASDMARQLLLGAALHDRRWSTSRKLRQAYRRRQAERRGACDPCREGTH